MKMFYEGMEPLRKKLACILVQLPPTLTKDEGFKKLKQLPFNPIATLAHCKKTVHLKCCIG